VALLVSDRVDHYHMPNSVVLTTILEIGTRSVKFPLNRLLVSCKALFNWASNRQSWKLSPKFFHGFNKPWVSLSVILKRLRCIYGSVVPRIRRATVLRNRQPCQTDDPRWCLYHERVMTDWKQPFSNIQSVRFSFSLRRACTD